MPLPIEEAIEVYKDIATVPFLSSAQIGNKATPGHIAVHSDWVQRDLEKKEKNKYRRTHIIQLDVSIPLPPQKSSNILWSVESPSGKYSAIVRTKKEKEEEKQYVEIWNEHKQLKSIKVADLKVHGNIYGPDGHFASFEWNRGETHLLYVAETKKPKQKSFFDTVESEDDITVRGEEYTYQETWGEQLTKCHKPVIAVLDVEAGVASVLENLPETVAPGQAIWSPDDLGVVCVGWNMEPYRLGMIYCPIRENTLYFIDLKTYSCSVLDGCGQSVRSPVFSPDGTKLVYLACPAGGPHFQCASLEMIDWATKGKVRVVDCVRKAIGSDFPGIFTLSLPTRCWASDSRRIVFSSIWRSKIEMICINIESGKITRITDDAEIGSWTVHDVQGDLVLASCSSPNVQPYVVIGQLPEAGQEMNIKWTKLDKDLVTREEHVNVQIMKLDIPQDRRHPSYPELNYEAILMLPTQSINSKPPLVVFPHGGPHTTFVTEYTRFTSFLTRCGYAVLMINYRGSIGFGQDSIESLPGLVGDQDVKDCHAAVEKVMSTGKVDVTRVFVCGGSHGGFLTTHLIGQYPDYYTAAVARNPVINLASMLNSTDIPDWCIVEGYNKNFDQKQTSSADVYQRLWSMSPIAHVDKVKTPVLLMVGKDDLRVPNYQAQEYRKALQARAVPVKFIAYPDNAHPIESVEAEADACINILQWFNKHIKD